MKRLFSLILALMMVLSILPVPAFAAEADGLCSHHPEHTEGCGYAPAREAVSCGHTCGDGSCSYREAVEGADCLHQHDESCGYSEGTPCTCVDTNEDGVIDHLENCGYVAPTACQHQHDDTCGYVAAVEGVACDFVHENCGCQAEKAEQPCTYDCQECGKEPQNEPPKCICDVKCNEMVNEDCPVCVSDQNACEGEEPDQPPVCNCADKCTEGAVNSDCPLCSAEHADLSGCIGKAAPVCNCADQCTAGAVKADCPVCGGEHADLTACKGTPAPAVTENAKTVQSLIDALPTLEEVQAMTMEEQGNIYNQTQAAYGAYEKLTGEEKTTVNGAEIFETLLTYFATLTETIPENGNTWTDTVNITETRTIEGRVTVSGNVTLNLGAGCTLTINGGIQVTTGNTLTIYGPGSLIATADTNNAGIGGNGSSTGVGETCGTVIIYSGNITAKGGLGQGAAGIGGGGSSTFAGAGGTVTIHGGTVNATGGNRGAGIGGGGCSYSTAIAGAGGNVTIHGGTVTAIGGNTGVNGIGGGAAGNSGAYISGGPGSFSAPGSASITATSIADQNSKSNWGGIITDIDATYDSNLNLTSTTIKTVGVYSDQTIRNMTIPAGATLTVSEDKTLTVTGTLTNNGTVNGTLATTDNGIITGTGKFTSKPENAAIPKDKEWVKDGEYWKLAPHSTGPFTVTGGEYGEDYEWNGADDVKKLTIKTSSLTVSNTDPSTTANACIQVNSNVTSLTLNGVNITAPADNNALAALGTLTISLAENGVNTLTGATGKNGIFSAGDLTIQGSGTLNANGGAVSSGPSYGIYSNTSVAITGGIVNATGGEGSQSFGSIGIGISPESTGTITISGGSGTAKGSASAVSSSATVALGTGMAKVEEEDGKTMKWGPAVNITTQPTDQTVTVGETATFTVAAENGTSYQWQSSSNGTDWTNVSGATNASYTIENTTTTMSGTQYRCVVGNEYGTVTSDAATLTVNKFVSDLPLTVNQNGIFTYGDTIIVEFTPERKAKTRLAAPVIDQAALFLGDTQLTDPVEADGNGKFTLSYDTSNKGIPIGENQTLTVKYGGSDTLNAGEAPVKITLNQRKLTVTGITGVDRFYEPGNKNVSLDLSKGDYTGEVPGDDVSLFVGAVGTIPDDDAGHYEVDFEDITLIGEDAEFYTLEQPKVTVNIKKAPVTITAKNQTITVGGKISQGVDQVEVSGLLGEDTLNGITLKAANADKVGTGTITPSDAKLSGNAQNYDVQYVNGTLTVTAPPIVTVTLTFETNGGSKIAPQEVVIGEKAKTPDAPTREGYAFKGWFVDSDCTKPFSFRTKLTKDTTLYAKWAKLYTYELNFRANTDDDVRHLPDDLFVTSEQDEMHFRIPFTRPKRDGYTFTAWYTSRSGKADKYKPGARVEVPANGEITLYARWTPVDRTNAKTGDYIRYAIYTLAISGAALAGVIVYSKKKKK